jgi:hypothetical protein
MNIRTYVENHAKLSHLKEGGSRGEFRGECPFHGSNNSHANFAVNVGTGMWVCRSASCGLRGGFPLLYKLLEGIVSWGEVKKRLDSTVPIKNWAEVLQFQGSFGSQDPEINFQPLPSDLFQYPLTKENFPDYLKVTRKYSPDLLDFGFDIRFCHAGEYRSRLLFPFYDLDGKLCTFTARSIVQSEPVRYRFPEAATTTQFLYGVHRLGNVQPKRFFVVEGQFDVMRLATYGEYAVGASTVTLSSKQLMDIKKLAELYQCQVYILFDSGAYNKSQMIWSSLRSLGLKRCDPVDIGEHAKDPDELSYSSLMELVGAD